MQLACAQVNVSESAQLASSCGSVGTSWDTVAHIGHFLPRHGELGQKVCVAVAVVADPVAGWVRHGGVRRRTTIAIA